MIEMNEKINGSVRDNFNKNMFTIPSDFEDDNNEGAIEPNFKPRHIKENVDRVK